MRRLKKVIIILFVIYILLLAAGMGSTVFFVEPKGPPAWQEWEDAYGHQPIIK